MANVKVPAKVADRLKKQVRIYQKRLTKLLANVGKPEGVSEDDTVTIVVDMLNGVFGFEKDGEITQQYRIKRKFCDVAVKLGDDIQYLVEVKPIGIPLKDDHIEQAVNYAAREEKTDWVVLTNGIRWLVFRVLLTGKVSHEQVCDFDFTDMKPTRNTEHQETLFMLSKEGVNKALIEKLYEHQQVVNEHTIAAVLMRSDEVHKVIVRELKKQEPNAKPDKGEIARIINDQIMPRVIVENEKTTKAITKIEKMQRKQKSARKKAARAANENKGQQEE